MTRPALVTEKAVFDELTAVCSCMRLPVLALIDLTSMPLTSVFALVVPVPSTIRPIVLLPVSVPVSVMIIFWPLAVTPVPPVRL